MGVFGRRNGAEPWPSRSLSLATRVESAGTQPASRRRNARMPIAVSAGATAHGKASGPALSSSGGGCGACPSGEH